MAAVNTPILSNVNGSLRVSGSISPVGDTNYSLGTTTNRFSDLFATQTTIGAFCESGLKTQDIGINQTGTIVVWNNGGLVPCYKEEDEFVMGVIKNGKDEPIILGAEPVLVTGKIKTGDYIVTSEKIGHGKAADRGMIFKKNLFGKVIAQALFDGDGESYTIKAMITKM